MRVLDTFEPYRDAKVCTGKCRTIAHCQNTRVRCSHELIDENTVPQASPASRASSMLGYAPIANRQMLASSLSPFVSVTPTSWPAFTWIYSGLKVISTPAVRWRRSISVAICGEHERAMTHF